MLGASEGELESWREIVSRIRATVRNLEKNCRKIEEQLLVVENQIDDSLSPALADAAKEAAPLLEELTTETAS